MYSFVKNVISIIWNEAANLFPEMLQFIILRYIIVT